MPPHRALPPPRLCRNRDDRLAPRTRRFAIIQMHLSHLHLTETETPSCSKGGDVKFLPFLLLGLSYAIAHAEPSPEGTQLMAALKSAKAGDTITLRPGAIYSGIQIVNFSGPLIIVGSTSNLKSTITDLKISNSKNITIKNIEFSLNGVYDKNESAANTIPIQVNQSREIHFDHFNVHGSPRGTLSDTPSGILFRASDNVSITDSEFSYLHNAFAHINDTHLVVARNNFHNLWDDAIRGGGSSFVTIESNYCHSNHPDLKDLDHPDCIQFWTSNTTTPTHDIVIRNNRYERGSGTAT